MSVPLLRGAGNDDLFQLHLAAIDYALASPITIRSREDIKSARHWSEHFEPFEHQVRNLITFCRRAPVALIADEVGLGKTISAGLILSELMTRKKVRRALILCPKLLLPQWCEELTSKFEIETKYATGGELEFLLRSNLPVVVTTYETARNRIEDLSKSFFDMLILDEAHKLRNLYGSAQIPQVALALHKSLRDRDFKYVVMLTATPIQNRLWDVYSLIDCLATARGHRNPLGSTEGFANYYLEDSRTTARELKKGRREEFRRKISEYMVRTSRRDSSLVFPERHVQTIGCPPGKAENELSRLVSQALPDLNALARTSLAEALMSSPAALVSQLNNMAANGTVPSDVAARAEVLAAETGMGCKIERLIIVLDELAKERGDQWRAVLFTRRKESQDLIARVLGARGMRIGFIRGGQAVSNQRAIDAFRSEPPRINLLISTDAGAEGVNLQAANVIVNYDLPWNPMVVEQRIGRVQRLASKHRFIVVVNLVVAGSVEEVVVGRLLDKLQTISESIGDVEGILETTSVGEEDFETTIRELVMKALMGQDVSLATERIRRSIERAKATYEEEKAEVDKSIGALDAMHSAGPTLPTLEDLPPRLNVEQFVRAALVGDGAEVTRMEDGRWLASTPGRAPIIITFDEGDPDLFDDGVLGFNRRRAELFAMGRPAFERLVGEWAKRDSSRIADHRDPSGDLSKEILQDWARSIDPEVTVDSWVPGPISLRFFGELSLRASASVGHDRYEKIVTIPIAPPQPPPDSTTGAASQERWIDGEFDLRRSVPDIAPLVMAHVGDDKDVRQFCDFYDARRAEEISKVAFGERRLAQVTTHFQPTLAAELVGAHGFICNEVSGTVGIRICEAATYEVPVTLSTHGQRVIVEPLRSQCTISGWSYPLPCLAECAITRSMALKHLLVASELSGRLAIPEHVRTCESTGRRLLSDEVLASDVSGQIVDATLLLTSVLSGKRGLPHEMVACDFTKTPLLVTEGSRSDVSGKLYRPDQEAFSGASGIRGHRSEFIKCESTGRLILPSESGKSNVSGKTVSRELLVSSEKNPERMGLLDETVSCVISGKRVMMDEADRSSVSGKWVDKELLVRSARSGALALPEELVKCQASGSLLLPSEVSSCTETGLTVDVRLLAKSDLSGRLVQRRLLLTCPETKKLGLEAELGRCAATNQLVDPALLVTCTVTGMQVLKRLTIRSAVSQRPMLRDRAVIAQSARVGHPDEIHVCTWTGWKLLSDEIHTCAVTGAPFSKTHLDPSGISQAHAHLLRDHERLAVCTDDSGARAARLLEARDIKANKIWTKTSDHTSVVAVLGEAKSIFGLRRRLAVCFMDPGGSQVGQIRLLEHHKGRWT